MKLTVLLRLRSSLMYFDALRSIKMFDVSLIMPLALNDLPYTKTGTPTIISEKLKSIGILRRSHILNKTLN